MHNLIKKNINKILSIFLLLQPVLDLLTGICLHTFNLNLTIGIFVRILFLLLIMFTTSFIYKKKLPIYIYILIFLYSLFYLLGIIIYKDGVVFKEIQNLVKVFYFPLILISLYSIKDEIKISKMTLFITLLLYLILILIPNLLGIGFKSYEITKSGTLGFFNSANEISGIISILTPIIFIILKDIKGLVLKIIITIIYLFVILTIGTKTPLLTLLITISFTYLYYIISCVKKKTYKPIVATGGVILIALASLLLVLPKTNFYKNIETHLEFLEVDNILDVFKEKELIDHFIFSQRLTFLDNKAELYTKASTYEKFFGIGYTNKGQVTKLIEIDYFDILYSHGIIGFIVFFGSYSYVFINLLKERSKENNYETFMTKLSVFLVLILSFFTGHIITAPAASIFAIILIILLYKPHHKKIIYIVNDNKEDEKLEKLLTENESLERVTNKNLKVKNLLLDYHTYDLAIYTNDSDEKIANLYSTKTYKYTKKIKDIKDISN